MNTLTTDSAEKRRLTFQKCLVDTARRLHESFIRFYGCSEWSRESGSKWHPRFAIDPFSDIDLAPLPAKPENRSQTNIHDFTFNNSEEMRQFIDRMKKSSTKKFQSDCEEYGGQFDSKLMKYVAR